MIQSTCSHAARLQSPSSSAMALAPSARPRPAPSRRVGGSPKRTPRAWPRNPTRRMFRFGHAVGQRFEGPTCVVGDNVARWAPLSSLIIRSIKPAGSCPRVFLATSGTLRGSSFVMAAAELGNRQSRKQAARSHVRAAFLCLRLLCAPERYRANSENTPRRLRELRFSTSSGFARLSRHMQGYATRFQLSSSTCASLSIAAASSRTAFINSINSG